MAVYLSLLLMNTCDFYTLMIIKEINNQTKQLRKLTNQIKKLEIKLNASKKNLLNIQLLKHCLENHYH